MVILVTPKAELEPGLMHWVAKLSAMSRQNSLPVLFYAHPTTIAALKSLNKSNSNPIELKFKEFTEWDDFLILSREVDSDDLFIIVSSRKGNLSYNPHLEKLSYYLCKYFNKNSFIILYPGQLESRISLNIPVKEGINEAGHFLKHFMKRKEE
jgi:hypothetical protein